MGTRGVIARPAGDGFEGRYHHWDSYPTGLGQTLFHAVREYFNGDVDAAIDYFIVQHSSWSTINGADFSMPSGFRDFNFDECEACGRPSWQHYVQYYDSETYNTEGLAKPKPFAEGTYGVFDHQPVTDREKPHGAECHCHGTRSEPDNGFVKSEGDSWGTEWAYVLGRTSMFVFVYLWADDSRWEFVSEIPWDRDPEMIDWQNIEARGDALRDFNYEVSKA